MRVSSNQNKSVEFGLRCSNKTVSTSKFSLRRISYTGGGVEEDEGIRSLWNTSLEQLKEHEQATWRPSPQAGEVTARYNGHKGAHTQNRLDIFMKSWPVVVLKTLFWKNWPLWSGTLLFGVTCNLYNCNSKEENYFPDHTATLGLVLQTCWTKEETNLLHNWIKYFEYLCTTSYIFLHNWIKYFAQLEQWVEHGWSNWSLHRWFSKVNCSLGNERQVMESRS